jgi:hypothetical protein
MPARFKKNPDAVLVGGLGCQKGGVERAKQLHPKHLSHIGKYGAKCRWT